MLKNDKVRCLNVSVVFLLLSMLTACFTPKIIRQEQALVKSTVLTDSRVSQHLFSYGAHRLFYAAAGDPQKPTLIIMHGTPGNWHQYARYLINSRLLEYFYIVVIDRPGWGQSSLGDNQSIASFDLHSDILAALAATFKENNGGQPLLIMGHSLGASIAPKVAMNYPQAVDGLLLFAGTLSPKLSQPRWFNHLAKNVIVNRLIGDTMRKSNLEILALENEIQAMADRLQSMEVATLVVQGMKDRLVYPDNIIFAETQFNTRYTETLRLQTEGHLFPMTRREDVVRWSICLLEKIQSVNPSAPTCTAS